MKTAVWAKIPDANQSISLWSESSEMPAAGALQRITANPAIFGGKPIIRGMRISVEMILSLLAQGATSEEIIDDYPDLEIEDIRACLEYARAAIANDVLDGV